MPREQTDVRNQADALGINYHHNASDETIQKLIDSHTEDAKPIPNILPIDQCQPLDEVMFKRKYGGVVNSKKASGRLIRCRVQCLNPAKKDWPGEIFSVGSAKLGTFKKHVPFNSPEAYHLPKIIYDMLVDKKCTVFHTERDARGNKIRKGKLVNEFAIEVLPPLTKAELKELADRQSRQAA